MFFISPKCIEMHKMTLKITPSYGALHNDTTSTAALSQMFPTYLATIIHIEKEK